MNLVFDNLLFVMFAFQRAGALFVAIPVFAGRVIPLQVRLALALLVAFIASSQIPGSALLPDSTGLIVLISINEVLIGLLMGMAVRVLFSTIGFAGHIISIEIGLMMSSSVNPLNESSSTTVGSLLFYFAALLFLISGTHYEVIYAFVRSFEVLPVGQALSDSISLDLLVRDTAKIFLVGMQIAAPIIAINFLVNMTFAVLGKVAPKVNVFITSFAVRILTGMAVLFATTGLIAHYILDRASGVPEMMLKLLSN